MGKGKAQGKVQGKGRERMGITWLLTSWPWRMRPLGICGDRMGLASLVSRVAVEVLMYMKRSGRTGY
jgi:hypothetical protein